MKALVLLLLAVSALFLHTPSAMASDWWSTQHDYRVSFTVGANGHTRTDKPVELAVDFTALLAGRGLTGAFDPDSLRVVEVSNGAIIDVNVPFQFDTAPAYDPVSQAAGSLILLLTGNTDASNSRTYHVYFDIQGKGFTLPYFAEQTSVTTVDDEGQSSFRVQTTNATYFYQKEAGGFSSLHDVNDNDWINYHPLPVNSPSSSYRGIPNMVHPEGLLHPGATGHTSTLVHTGPLKTTIRTVIDTDGDLSRQWDVLWEFFPAYARMTVNDVEHDYWFLYEGTPGGDLEPDTDFVVRSNGTQTLASKSWTSDLAGEEWVYFADPALNRALYLVNHAEDTLVDSYRPMADANGDMTVFGFGRQKTNKLLSQTPAYFTLGLMDTTAHAEAAPLVRAAYKPLAIVLGGLEQRNPGSDITTVPDLSGLAQADAEAMIASAGLVVGLVSTTVSSSIPAGHVVSQTPAAGTSTPVGANVDLVVSAGASGSDEFTGPLDTSRWTFIDPLGGGSVTTTGSQVAITVPAGAKHDAWKSGNTTARIMQVASNTDFEIEAKFDSPLTLGTQIQGFLIEQSPTSYLRFDIFFDGVNTKLFSAYINNTSASTKLNTAITPGIPVYLRVNRTGDQWTYSYSLDGAIWTVAKTFSQVMTVNAFGLYAGNAGTLPGFTALVDYFRMTGDESGSGAPIAAPDAFTVDANSVANVLDVKNNDSDPEGDALSLVAVSVPSHGGTVVINDNGTYADATDDYLEYTPAAGFTGTETFVYDITDGALTSQANVTVTVAAGGGIPSGLVSDEFSGATLDSGLWSIFDPLGDSAVSITAGGQLAISVPAGTSHDLWKNALNAPRVRQPANDTDVQLEVKFDSALGARFQLQGITIEQDANNLLRFDFYSDGATTYVYSASFANGLPTKRIQKTLTAGAPLYLRVVRQGNLWTQSYSHDGGNWLVAGSYSYTLAMNSVGVFGGNGGTPAPAHTALVDYFRVDGTPAP
jgi:hypothetical protein